MKKLILISLLSVLSLTALPVKASGEHDAPLGAWLGISSWAALFVCFPVTAAIGGAALSVTGGTMLLMKDRKEAVRVAVNADAQDFFQIGTASIALSQMIEQVKLENNNLSDEEAVDLIVKFVNE
jgi:hypothetical protein